MKNANLQQLQTIMENAQVERDQAQQNLIRITDQEKKDEEMIGRKLQEHKENFEKDKRIKDFIKKKLVVQNELLKTYKMARIEEEKKLESTKLKNQSYQEW